MTVCMKIGHCHGLSSRPHQHQGSSPEKGCVLSKKEEGKRGGEREGVEREREGESKGERERERERNRERER